MSFKDFYEKIYFEKDRTLMYPFHAVQGDKGSRGFYVDVLQNSVVINLTGLSMVANFYLPSGNKTSANGVVENGMFRIDIPNDVFIKKGIVKGQLTLKGTTNEVISNNIFEINVTESVESIGSTGDPGDTPEGDFTLLRNRVGVLEGKVNDLESGGGTGGGLTEAQVKAIKVNNSINADKVGGFTVEKNVPANADFSNIVYSHPVNHPASIITESTTKKFVSDTEKSTWNGKQDKLIAGTNISISGNTINALGGGTGGGLTAAEVKAIKVDNAVNADKVGGFTVGVNVPSGAKFTDNDTITSINGKTGVIEKADIVALGIPEKDTTYTAGANISISEGNQISATVSVDVEDLDLTAYKEEVYSTKQIQVISEEPKPIVVFTFDDGYKEDLTVMKPLFAEYGYNPTTYILSGLIGGEYLGYDLMNEGEIRVLSDFGWEIGSHTMTHIGMGTNTDDVIDYEMKESKRVLTDMGFSVNNFAYPFGEQNAFAQRTSMKYYRSSTLYMSGIIANTIPINKPALHRIALGSSFDIPNDEFTITNTFDDYYKKWVDKAIENNAITIFALHSGPISESPTQMQYLRDTLNYCKANDISVMTLNEALNHFDNKLDIKIYNKDNTVKNEFLIDANGNLNSNYMLFTSYLSEIGIDNDTLPDVYPKNSTSIVDINNGLTLGFPENNFTLYTTVAGNWADVAKQDLCTKWTNKIYLRTAKEDGSWNEWTEIQTDKFVKLAYTPILEDENLLPNTGRTYTINEIIPWQSILTVSPTRKLPAGVFCYVWSDSSSIYLELYNASEETAWLTTELEFNIKAI